MCRVGKASGQRHGVFADEAEHRDTLLNRRFSAPADSLKPRRRCGLGGGFGRIRHMLTDGCKQIGEFGAQITNLNHGTRCAQPCQKLLQHPRTGGIECLDRCAVDDQL